jgi:predicted AlkP superfamily phosphohydrolase/phosphomutase
MLPTDSLSDMKFATGKDIRDTTVYELLDQNGITPILVNLPGTYPPKLKNAITITSLLTQGDQWIFPESLKDEFPAFKNYRLTPNENLRLKERREAYIEDLLKHLEEQTTCVQWLFEHKPWNFFFYLFSHTDWVSHLAYTELREQDDPSARRIFLKIDEHVKWFVDHLPKDANLIMLSDHGFKSYKKIFYFNRWLEDNGYLATNTASDQFRGAATRRAKETDKIRGRKKQINLGSGVFRRLSRFPRVESAAKWVYHHIVKRYMPVNVKVHVGIDFSKTQVCFPKGSYITNAYINKAWVYSDGIVTQEAYKQLRDELVAKMSAITDPDGQPVIKRVLTRDEVYGNDAPANAPDLFFELGDYWLVGQFHSGKLFADEIQNKHDPMGMFAAYGPDFASGSTVEGLEMQDMTPLLLHLNGLPVPSDCDGHVPIEVFADSSEAKTRVITFGEPIKKTASPRNEKASIANALQKIKL